MRNGATAKKEGQAEEGLDEGQAVQVLQLWTKTENFGRIIIKVLSSDYYFLRSELTTGCSIAKQKNKKDHRALFCHPWSSSAH